MQMQETNSAASSGFIPQQAQRSRILARKSSARGRPAGGVHVDIEEIPELEDEVNWDLLPPQSSGLREEHLVPVLRRVDPVNRNFPHGRIVYEPEKRETKKHRLHKFQPYQLDLILDEERKFTWELNPPPDERDNRRDPDRRSHLLSFEYTKVHQYYRFDCFHDLPIHIFYKDASEGDDNYVELHCITIPVEFLRREVLKDRRKHMTMAKTRLYRN
jgi:hypothetical protein